jgi:hypothetical protein
VLETLKDSPLSKTRYIYSQISLSDEILRRLEEIELREHARERIHREEYTTIGGRLDENERLHREEITAIRGRLDEKLKVPSI